MCVQPYVASCSLPEVPPAQDDEGAVSAEAGVESKVFSDVCEDGAEAEPASETAEQQHVQVCTLRCHDWSNETACPYLRLKSCKHICCQLP